MSERSPKQARKSGSCVRSISLSSSDSKSITKLIRPNACPFVAEFFQSLFALYMEKHLTDITIVIDAEHRFNAHRIVLSASSHFFRAMFTNNALMEAKSPEIKLTGSVVDPQSFKTILDYMYSRHLALKDETVCQVLQTACYLLMRDVEVKCCDYLSRILSSKNIFDLLNLANILSSQVLTDLLSKFICRQGIAIFAKEQEFHQIDVDVLKRFLGCGMAGSVSEDTLLEILLQWVAYNVETRRSALADLLDLIKLPLVQPNLISEKLKGCDLIKYSDVCREKFEASLGLNSDSSAWPVEPRCGSIFCNSAVNFLSNFQVQHSRWSSDIWAPYNINLTNVTLFSLDQYTLGVVGSEARESVTETDEVGLGSSVATYNYQSRQWDTLPSLTTARCRPAVCTLPYAELIVVAGGVSQLDDNPIFTKPFATCEALYLPKDRWKPFSPLPWNGGDGVRLIPVQDQIFALGGHTGDAVVGRSSVNNVAHLSVSQLLDEDFEIVKTARWKESMPMRDKRSYFGAALVNEEIFCVGGSNETGALKTVERFDPIRLEWSIGVPLPRAAPSVAAVAYNGLLCCLLSFQSDDRPGLAPYEMMTFDPRDNMWHYGSYVTSPCRIGISYPSMIVVSD